MEAGMEIVTCWNCKRLDRFHTDYGWCLEFDIPVVKKKGSANITKARRCPVFVEEE
jgi:hypothetical protein